MSIIRTAALMLAAGSALLVGCGSGDKSETAQLRSEVAALRQQVGATTTTLAADTTSTSSSTTTTIASTTTTTIKPTTTTTRAIAVTTTTKPADPACSLRALASPVTRGMTQRIYLTSNLPGRQVVMGQTLITTDASGSATYSFAASGGYMDQYGHYSPRTNTFSATFYARPWTLDMVVDQPAPPVVTSCTTTYLAIGPT